MKIFIVRQESHEVIFDNDSIQLGDYTLRRRGRKAISLGDLAGGKISICDLREICQGARIKPAGGRGTFPFRLSRDEDKERNVYMKGDVALELILEGLFQALPDSTIVRVE